MAASEYSRASTPSLCDADDASAAADLIGGCGQRCRCAPAALCSLATVSVSGDRRWAAKEARARAVGVSRVSGGAESKAGYAR